MNTFRLFSIVAFALSAVLSLSMNNNVLAQTKKTALPDSSKKEKIELPDVLIYGKDKSVRKTGDKIDLRQEDVKLIPPTVNYQPASTIQDFDNQKVAFSKSSQRSTSRAMLQIDYGKFQQFDALAGYWKETEKLNTSIHGNYSRSEGQFDNSQYFIANLNGQFGSYLSENFFMTLRGSFYASEYGMYTVKLADAERTVSDKSISFDSRLNVSDDQSIELGITVHQNNFDDADTVNYTSELDERNVSLSARYTTKFGTTRLNFASLYQYNKINNFNVLETVNSQKYFHFKSWILQPLGKYVVFKPGIIVENLDLSNSFSGTLVSPEVEIVFTPTNKFGIRLKSGREYSPLTYSEQWKSNPFVSHSFNFIPMKKSLELKAGIEIRPLTRLSFFSEVTFQKWENYAYWFRELTSGLFSIHSLEKANLTTVNVRGKYQLSEKLIFNAGLLLFYDSIEDESVSSERHIPYLSAYKIPISFELQFLKNASAQLGFQWIGPRHYSLDTDETLDDYALLSLMIEASFHKHLTGFASGKNLLDQKHEPWLGYPGMGWHFEIGFRAHW